jgi:hypothetical protein
MAVGNDSWSCADLSFLIEAIAARDRRINGGRHAIRSGNETPVPMAISLTSAGIGCSNSRVQRSDL